jgi:hypothetical protein
MTRLAELTPSHDEIARGTGVLRRSLGLRDDVASAFYAGADEQIHQIAPLIRDAELASTYAEMYTAACFTGLVVGLSAAQEAGEYAPASID